MPEEVNFIRQLRSVRKSVATQLNACAAVADNSSQSPGTGNSLQTSLECLKGNVDAQALRYLQAARGAALRTVSQLMWRNEHTLVQDQLMLPEKHEEVVYLEFSRIEEAFYGRLFESVEESLNKLVRSWEPLSDAAEGDLTGDNTTPAVDVVRFQLLNFLQI